MVGQGVLSSGWVLTPSVPSRSLEANTGAKVGDSRACLGLEGIPVVLSFLLR